MSAIAEPITTVAPPPPPIPSVPTAEQRIDARQVTENAVLISVYLGFPGNRKKVSTSKVTFDAEIDLVSVSKKLLIAPELDAIGKHDRAIRLYLKERCMPFPFRGGVYMLPSALAIEADEKMKDFAVRRRQLIEDFAAAYEQRRDETLEKLRGLGDITDYPPKEKVLAVFQFSWQFMSFAPPERLRGLSRSLFEQEKQKAAQKWVEAAELGETLMRQTMRELVTHLRDQLQPGEDGEKKRLTSSAVTKLREFLSLADIRNVTGDQELSTMIDQAKAAIQNVDVRVLRDSEMLRDEIRESMATITASLNEQLTRRGSRLIDVNDLEA